MTALVVFEDEGAVAFEQLAALRGVFDLRCGARTLLERLQQDAAAQSLVLIHRPEISALVAESHPDTAAVPARGHTAFVNARFLSLGQDLAGLFAWTAGLYFKGEALVAARLEARDAVVCAEALRSRLQAPDARPFAAWCATALPHVPRTELDGARTPAGSRLLEHAWDLVACNGLALVDDFRKSSGAGIAPEALLYPGVHLVQDGAIRIEAGTRIKPGVVLDAEDGPILIGRDVVVQPQVVIRGPAAIGAGCLLKAGAKIHEGTSLGPVCKIGGEVEESIVQGFSNKQHEGFLGHAYLGEWVNLGADTNNSDLKNNYSTVRVWENGRSIDSGLRFVGLLAADHVKSAINTQFNTGTVVGLASQIFGAGFPPKFVPPFSWGGGETLDLYDGQRALATARRVMERRGVRMSAAYAERFLAVFQAWSNAPRRAAV
jgi:UDP-N-acetylglucosamine diphosphorylase/glucosamine-1-phosphate N-acetyltransferase